jgi:Putative Flp pilus-assembly TadE/G-like
MTNACYARLRNERGAVLVHVTVAIIGILAFSALVVDYGVMWASRRQAQNAADAAALAGAISMTFAAPGDFDRARAVSKGIGESNTVFGQAPNITEGTGDGCDPTQDISFPYEGACSMTFPNDQCPVSGACVRVNVYRNALKDALPTFFGRLFGMLSQGVKATATAETSNGNSADCMLPFAVIDRWADNYDEAPDNTYFANDSSSGTAGWSPNDIFQPASGDVYEAPYNGNTAHTGWKVDVDYGRQLVLKGGLGTYSSGWAQQIDLPDSTGSKDYKWNITHCNEQPVGIAEEDTVCNKDNYPSPYDESDGCISVKTGMAQGPTSTGINDVVAYDSAAYWDATAPGPEDGLLGAVVGGKGMSTPRIRPLAIIDIQDYVNQGCDGTGCVGKVANIIGFFLEGMCKDVTLDPGMLCEDPNKDVVGRIVRLPGDYAKGGGTTEVDASFVRTVRLIR